MKQVIKTVVVVSAVTAGLFVGIDLAMSTPDVLVSYSTNTCTQVINYEGILFPAGNYDCENLPEKYNHIYVK
jgi:hypothetical protein